MLPCYVTVFVPVRYSYRAVHLTSYYVDAFNNGAYSGISMDRTGTFWMTGDLKKNKSVGLRGFFFIVNKCLGVLHTFNLFRVQS